MFRKIGLVTMMVLATLLVSPGDAESQSSVGPTIDGEVTHWYTQGLGRAPDSGGFSYWTGVIRSDCPDQFGNAGAWFLNSDEYWDRYGSNEARVRSMYLTLLHRVGDTAGINHWTGVLNAGGRSAFFPVLHGIATSTEAQDNFHIAGCRNYEMPELDYIALDITYASWKSLGGQTSGNVNNPTAPGQQVWPWANWSNNGCNLVGPGPFDFTWACRRHDFGWRNLKDVDAYSDHVYSDVWTGFNRSMTDSRFRSDMGSRCAEFPWYERPQCWTLQQTYYTGVKNAPGEPGYNTPHLPPFTW